MPAESILCVFVKYPEPGLVKTRIAGAIGMEEAARFYRVLAETVLDRTRSPGYERIVFYSPPERKGEIAAWLGNSTRLAAQRGGDLGERMRAAFDLAFGNGARRVVLIGTDVPMLDGGIVRRAFLALDKYGCVLGPSSDGGYYLIGLSEMNGELFRDVEWGTGRVLGRTEEIARRLGLRYTLLDVLSDVDDLEDIHRLKRVLDAGDPSLRSLAGVIGGIT